MRDEVDRMYERALDKFFALEALTNGRKCQSRLQSERAGLTILVEAESVGRDNKHGFVREDRGEVIDSHSEAWINDC
jgi:hypothetical protein